MLSCTDSADDYVHAQARAVMPAHKVDVLCCCHLVLEQRAGREWRNGDEEGRDGQEKRCGHTLFERFFNQKLTAVEGHSLGGEGGT